MLLVQAPAVGALRRGAQDVRGQAERCWRDEVHPHSVARAQLDKRMDSAAILEVAEARDCKTLQPSQLALHGVQIKQRLRWVLACPVALHAHAARAKAPSCARFVSDRGRCTRFVRGRAACSAPYRVDDRLGCGSRRLGGAPLDRMAEDKHIGVALEAADRVAQRLALLRRRRRLVDRNDLPAEAEHGRGERAHGARGRLIKDVGENAPLEQVTTAVALDHRLHLVRDREERAARHEGAHTERRP